MIGSHIDRYHIVRRLGQGGMGTVYVAEDQADGRTVALKIPHDHVSGDPHSRDRFLREARLAAALDHPALCAVYDAGRTEDGLVYIAMELVEGRPLSDLVADGPLASELALDLARQLAEGLAHAHAAGVLHRDLKPANILVDDAGRARILDFGLAVMKTDARLTRPGTTPGTPAYTAPELIQGGEPDERSDLWSLGVILYEMLTGSRPFQGEFEAAVLYAVMHEDPAPLSAHRADLPGWLQSVLDRLLAKNPADRFATAGALLDALRVQDGRGPARAPSGRRVRVRLIASLLALALAPAWLLLRGAGPDPGIDAPYPIVAVMPFANATGDSLMGFLARDLAGDLIDGMTRLPTLRTVARGSALSLDPDELAPAEAADRLGAAALVYGDLLSYGRRTAIRLRLYSHATDTMTWEQQFTAAPEDLGTLQERMVDGLAEALGAAGRQPRPDEFVQRRVDPDAYRHYLIGCRLTERWGNQRIWDEAIEYFRQATILEPEFAAPYARLARVYAYKSWFSTDPGLLAMSRDALAQALALDPDLPDALLVQAELAYWYDADWDGAERSYRRALQLAPGDVRLRSSFGSFLAFAGRCDEALEHSRLATTLDPLSYQSARNNNLLLVHCERFSACVADAMVMRDRFPNQFYTEYNLIHAYTALGRHDAAVAIADSIVDRFPQSAVGVLFAPAYWQAGQQERAWRLLEKGKSPSEDRIIRICLLSLEGRRDEAFAELEAAVRDYRVLTLFTLLDVSLAPLREDRRYGEIMAGVGVPGY